MSKKKENFFVQIKTPLARLQFPDLNPEKPAIPEYEGGTGLPIWQVDLIFDPKTEGFPEFMQEVKDLNARARAEYPRLEADEIKAVRFKEIYELGGKDGDKPMPKSIVGHFKLSVKRTAVYKTGDKNTPVVFLDNLGRPTSYSTFYGGCYAYALLTFASFDVSVSRGLRRELLALQFVKDGEPFGRPPVDVNQYFKAVPVENAFETPEFIA